MYRDFLQFNYVTTDNIVVKMRAFEDVDGEVWVVARDVCNALEIVNVSEALKSLDIDEKMTIKITEGQKLFDEAYENKRGGPRFLNVINESGMYGLIFKSRKPEAKAFRKWVTCEVLPQIRKTGHYDVPNEKGETALVISDKDEAEKFVESLTRRDRPIPQGHFKAARAVVRAAIQGSYDEAIALDEIFKSYTGFSALVTGQLIDEAERMRLLANMARDRMISSSFVPLFRPPMMETMS